MSTDPIAPWEQYRKDHPDEVEQINAWTVATFPLGEPLALGELAKFYEKMNALDDSVKAAALVGAFLQKLKAMGHQHPSKQVLSAIPAEGKAFAAKHGKIVTDWWDKGRDGK